MDVLRTAVSMLALYDPIAADMAPEANQKKAMKLVSRIATLVTSFDRLRNGKEVVPGDKSLGHAANFLYTLTGKKPDDVMEKVFDIALILHADHELNASTFAARVTAATSVRHLLCHGFGDRCSEGAAAWRRQRGSRAHAAGD